MGGRKDRADASDEGRKAYFMDKDRMVNEGLGGGNVTEQNGFIGNTTTDSMDQMEALYDDDGSV